MINFIHFKYLKIIPNSLYLNQLLNKLSTRILDTLSSNKEVDLNNLNKDYESYVRVSVFIRKLMPFVLGLSCTESSLIVFDRM